MYQSLIFILILAFTTNLFAATKLKTADDFFAESAKQRSSTKDKISAITELKKNLETTKAEYKKQNPNEADKTEEAVSTLYYTLKPVFDLSKKKFSKTDCEQTEHEITSQDQIGKDVDAKPSREATEALAWVKTLCANSK
jgi:hypothetical protein